MWPDRFEIVFEVVMLGLRLASCYRSGSADRTSCNSSSSVLAFACACRRHPGNGT